ncbi:MAG: HEAT repeat domain-containing protein [Kofleriaceae bacterium]
MTAPFALLLLACLGACPSRGTSPVAPTPAPDDTPARLKIAQLEAIRGGGLAELTELVLHGSAVERPLAIRALGRLGGARATEVLLGIVREGKDRARVAAAVAAIGLAASLDETTADPATTQLLVGSLGVAKDELAIEGIGRAADASAQPALVALLGAPPLLARAAAIALGRYGRRKLELSDASRAALATAGGHTDPGVRYAVAWALAREQLPPDAAADRFPDVTQRLAKLAADPEPEVRAQAISGLARRKTVRVAAPVITSALGDADWRVAVEAVRALTSEASDDAGRDAVAGKLASWTAKLAADPPRAHVVLEALRGLAPHARRPAVATAIGELRVRLANTLPEGTRGWIECLTTVLAVRAAPAPSYAMVETCALPDHLRLPLLAGLIDGDVGSLVERRRALRVLLAHPDVRVRGAGLGALASLWKAGDVADRRAAIAAVSSALMSKDAILVGSATEAAGALYELNDATERAALDAAVVTRARNEREADLATPLLELIGKYKLASGVAACRAGLAGRPYRPRPHAHASPRSASRQRRTPRWRRRSRHR